MTTYYFNTGVRHGNGYALYGRQVWRGGTKQIPFTCDDVPCNAVFWFACDNANLPESKILGVVVREITDRGQGGLMSKFAYFR